MTEPSMAVAFSCPAVGWRQACNVLRVVVLDGTDIREDRIETEGTMNMNAFRHAATLAFSVAFAGAVMAQSPSPQTPPQTPRSPAEAQQGLDNLKNMMGQTVTVSGCLAREGAAGETTTTAPAGTSGDFVLTNVQMRSSAPTPGATAPSGTPAMPGAADSKMRIKLKESGTAKLGENVNKRVEVTGRLEAGSSSPMARPGTTPGTPEKPEAGAPRTMAAGMMPELQVSNVRVLEEACTPKQ
jgi:hypothetical protein